VPCLLPPPALSCSPFPLNIPMSIATGIKRKRRAPHEGLPAGERLKRHKLAINDDFWTSPWGWVNTEVDSASKISPEHLKATCAFLATSGHAFCKNKFKALLEERDKPEAFPPASGSLDDAIVISEDETPGCSKRSCKKNPNCLNYLGQDKWADEGASMPDRRAARSLCPLSRSFQGFSHCCQARQRPQLKQQEAWSTCWSASACCLPVSTIPPHAQCRIWEPRVTPMLTFR
jgi:hypothetical protein